jgi:hypothetical protein
MKCLIDKLPDLEILKITVLGTLTQDMMKEVYPKAVSELNTNGYYRLLIDVVDSKISQNYTTRAIHTFDMADAIKKIETKKALKIALLSKDRKDGPEKTLKLAQSIGRLPIKFFSNYDEAITWLLGK